MIERQIKQLHAANIRDITIVVGYLKEKFEYLIDKYQVKLLYNPEYSCKNTLATVYRAREVLRSGMFIFYRLITGCGRICTIPMSAAAGILLFLWKAILLNGVFLLIRRDALRKAI